MRKINILSIALTLLSVSIAVYQFQEMAFALGGSSNVQEGRLTLGSIDKPKGNYTNEETRLMQITIENKLLKEEIERLRMSSISSAVRQSDKNSENSIMLLLAKLGFSILFGVSALFIVLSKKYEEGTEKWAFSVLTLISGVWVGTIS